MWEAQSPEISDDDDDADSGRARASQITLVYGSFVTREREQGGTQLKRLRSDVDQTTGQVADVRYCAPLY